MRQTGWIAIAVVLLIAVVFAISQTLTITLLSSPSTTSTTGTVSGMELISNELTLIRGCSDGELLKFSSGTGLWACNEDSTTATTGGAPTALDLEFDGVEESTDLVTIATTGAGATTIFSEPEPDVLLIDTDVAWPTTASHASSHADGGSDTLYVQREIVFGQDGDVSVAMAVENRNIYTRDSGNILDVLCSVNVAPTTDAVIVDVNLDGVTIFTTQGNRPQIAAGTLFDVSGAPDVATYVASQVFTIEIDQEDAGNTAAGLACQIRTREAVFDTAS